jgi:hypothetical protein
MECDMRRILPLVIAAGFLAGCAAMNTLQAEIATYGEWPAGQAAGSYAFDRLPSQQAQPEQTARLEDAARPALERAGFREAAPGQAPQVLVQVASASSLADPVLWADPLWWHGGWGYSRRVWTSPWWAADVYYDRRYDRQVALLIRDAATGKPLYEARASSEGSTTGSDAIRAALFEAAMVDFPRTGPNPRQVSVQVR